MKEGAQERVWGQVEKVGKGRPEGFELMRCGVWRMAGGGLLLAKAGR